MTRSRQARPGAGIRTLGILWTGLAGVLATVALAAEGEESEPWKAPARAARQQNPVPPGEEALRLGRRIYVRECLSCHGSEGHGNGPSAKELKKPPGDLASTQVHDQSDGALFWKISEGRKPMPGLGKELSETERWSIILYIRTFRTAASTSPPAAAGDPVQESLTALVASYELLRTRCSEGNLAGMQEEAKRWRGILEPAGAPDKAPKDDEAWRAAKESLLTQVQGILEAKEVEPARAAFARLSDGLWELAQARKLRPAATLKAYRCSKALDGKGALWFQNGDDRNNPYGVAGTDCVKEAGALDAPKPVQDQLPLEQPEKKEPPPTDRKTGDPEKTKGANGP